MEILDVLDENGNYTGIKEEKKDTRARIIPYACGSLDNE